jgi:hypothetical protein
MRTGGCLCGACRFVIDADLGPAAYCHCADCRRVTGSAFNVSVGVPADRFTMTQGTPASFTKTGDSGRRLTRHFCSACGSPLFTASPGHEAWLFVKAGALDDPGGITPAHESWTRSEVAWARIAQGLPRFDRDRTS